MQNQATPKNTHDNIKAWVLLYSDQLYSWALFKTSDKEIAEDLVQETFLAAFLNFTKFEERSEPKTWLFSILKNKIADHYRKIFKNKETNFVSINHFFDDGGEWLISQRPQEWAYEENENLYDNPKFKKVFVDCLQKLPPKWNASVLLKFVENKSCNQICQDLDITPTNYWQILHRAKLQLRKCLEMGWFKSQ